VASRHGRRSVGRAGQEDSDFGLEPFSGDRTAPSGIKRSDDAVQLPEGQKFAV